MGESLLVGKNQSVQCRIDLAYANRHGLISGATGTGKTVTLQTLAEKFSDAGVPVFLADVKGDLVGLGVEGGNNPRVAARNVELGLLDTKPRSYPVWLWDVYAEMGIPLRATVSDLGPLLLGKLLDLNATQQAVLSAIFAVADDNELPILDLKDLRAMIQFVGKNATELSEHYGNIASSTVGTILRAIIGLEEQGGDSFFGEPMLDVTDLLETDVDGRGQISILAANRLFLAPKLYSSVMLWLLSELYENLPEVGDLEKPKLALFFDEAHLLFEDTAKTLVDKIELVVRLIRSKGVAVFFVTQNPIDIPEDVLGQLGNRVHHALRAFSPKDQKTVRAAAQTLPANPALDTEKAIVDLGVGEALVSFLDDQGRPTPVERVFIVPPRSYIGAVDESTRQKLVRESGKNDKYHLAVDSQSAYELLKARSSGDKKVDGRKEGSRSAGTDSSEGAPRPKLGEIIKPSPQSAESSIELGGVFGSLVKSTLRTLTNEVGRRVVRGLMGSLLGSSRRR